MIIIVPLIPYINYYKYPHEIELLIMYLGNLSFRLIICSSALLRGGACSDDDGEERFVVSSLSSKLLLRAEPILFPKP